MLILIGDTRSHCNLAVLRKRRWGRMCVAKTPDPYQYEPWGFDCRAFKAWQDAGFPVGLTEEDWCILWDAADFEKWLAICRDIRSPPNSKMMFASDSSLSSRKICHTGLRASS